MIDRTQITLWLVLSSVFTLGLMFFKFGLEGFALRTILFMGTATCNSEGEGEAGD